MIEISRALDECSEASRRIGLFEERKKNHMYKPGRIESKSSRNSSSQTIAIRISEP